MTLFSDCTSSTRPRAMHVKTTTRSTIMVRRCECLKYRQLWYLHPQLYGDNILNTHQELHTGTRVNVKPCRPDRQQWLHRAERWFFHPHTWPLGSEAVGYRPDPRDSRHSQWCGVGSRCGFFVVRPPAHHSQLRLLSREGDSCYHQQVQLRPGQLGLVQEPSGNRRDKRRRCWPRRSEPTNSLLHSGSRQGSYTGDRWWAVTVE